MHSNTSWIIPMWAHKYEIAIILTFTVLMSFFSYWSEVPTSAVFRCTIRQKVVINAVYRVNFIRNISYMIK